MTEKAHQTRLMKDGKAYIHIPDLTTEQLLEELDERFRKNKCKVDFSDLQQQHMCHLIDNWYTIWRNSLVLGDCGHRLGFAKEELKAILCDKLIEFKNGFQFPTG